MKCKIYVTKRSSKRIFYVINPYSRVRNKRRATFINFWAFFLGYVLIKGATFISFILLYFQISSEISYFMKIIIDFKKMLTTFCNIRPWMIKLNSLSFPFSSAENYKGLSQRVILARNLF